MQNISTFGSEAARRTDTERISEHDQAPGQRGKYDFSSLRLDSVCVHRPVGVDPVLRDGAV